MGTSQQKSSIQCNIQYATHHEWNNSHYGAIRKEWKIPLQQRTIQTPSKFTPAKVALNFTPLVVARDGVTTGFTITPEIVTIAAGEW